MGYNKYLDISERKVLLRAIDIFVYIFSLWFANRFFDFYYINFNSTNIFLWITTLIFYVLLFGEIFQLYNLDISNNAYKVVKSIILTSLLTTLIYTFTPFITPSLPVFRAQIIYFFLIITFPIIGWRLLYMKILSAPKYYKSVVFVGDSVTLQPILNLVKRNGFYNIIYYISDNNIEGFDQFLDINSTDIKKIIEENKAPDVIISTNILDKNLENKVNKHILNLYEKGFVIKTCDDFYEDLTSRIPESYLNYNFYKKVNFSKNNNNNLYLFFIRFINIIISIIGILTFILFVPFILIGNLIGNRGQLFYTQERVGKKGKCFNIMKLRSMVKNAETDGAVWAIKNDARITAFGKFLRNTRLDEFPQFFNILKGEMSLIGPRPERPEFVKQLEEQIPLYGIRNSIRPGLTGWAQVNYPYASTLEEQRTKLRYDLYYIKERSLFLDFKIIIKTITTILFFRGQ